MFTCIIHSGLFNIHPFFRKVYEYGLGELSQIDFMLIVSNDNQLSKHNVLPEHIIDI